MLFFGTFKFCEKLDNFISIFQKEEGRSFLSSQNILAAVAAVEKKAGFVDTTNLRHGL
jgi:hypothetical protein